ERWGGRLLGRLWGRRLWSSRRWLRRCGWLLAGQDRGHRALCLPRPLLGLPGAALGPLDAVQHLLQTLLAPVLFLLQLDQMLRGGGATLGILGTTLDVLQPLLGLIEGRLTTPALLLKLALGGA